MKLSKIIVTGAAVTALLALAGCGPDPDTPMYTQQKSAMGIQDNPRVEVTRIGVIGDDLAYSGRRGIYVILDKKTQKEFIGISGVGITETGSHQAGKSSVQDER